MARSQKPLKRPKKTFWHLYSLQGLESERFVRTVNKILQKEFTLTK